MGDEEKEEIEEVFENLKVLVNHRNLNLPERL